MKKLKILEELLKISISIIDEERGKIYNFAKDNPDKIEEIIKIFEKEKIENLKIFQSYISN